MSTISPEAITESAALRALDWPTSRRRDLRAILPSMPAGVGRIYERAAVERLKTLSPDDLEREKSKGALLTRAGAVAEDFELVQRAIEIERAAIDTDKRTVELSFSSETPVDRWFGKEILSHKKQAVRLGRLNNNGPLLLDHDRTRQIGVVVSSRIDPDGKGRATVRFGRSALAEETFKDVEDGIRRTVSVGYRIHEQETQRDENGKDTVIVTDWEPYELSLVSVPADDSVGIGRGIGNKPTNPNKKHFKKMPKTNKHNNDNSEARREEFIYAMSRQMSDQGREVETQRAIEEGWSKERFRKHCLDVLCSNRSTFNPTWHPDDPPMSSRSYGNGSFPYGGQGDDYSLCRAIHAASQGRLDGFEAEVSQELARSMGKQPDGFFVPHSALVSHRGMSVTGNNGDNGGNAVGLMVGDFIEALRPMLATAQAGATIMSGLTSNVGIPRQAAASTASWKAETAALDEKTPEIDQLLLTPKRIGAWTKMSKQLVAQSTPSVEMFVRNDLLEAVAVGYDAAAINGTGDNNQPRGILNTTGIGAVVGGTNGALPTWEDLVELVSKVADANATGMDSSFIFSTKVEGLLRKTVKVDSTDSRMILEDGQTSLVGRPWFASNNVPNDLDKGSAVGVCSAIIFGNFRDLILANFGAGLDVVVDPYSLATTGQIRIVVQSFADIGIRRPQSFAAMKDALTE